MSHVENNTPSSKPQAASLFTSRLKDILLGAIIGGGATALVQEERIASVNDQKNALVQQGEDIIRQVYPFVVAATSEAKLPLPTGAYVSQSLPEEYQDSDLAALKHSESFGKAVEAFRAQVLRR